MTGHQWQPHVAASDVWGVREAQVAFGRRATDALPVIIVYLVALYAIPAGLVVRPLGAAGTPAQIIGVGLLVWWFASQLITGAQLTPTNPVKWALLLFAAALLTSYVGGMSRPIGSTLEVNSSDRAVLSLAAWCGVVLVFADGIATRERIERLVQYVACAATIIAALGYLQFFFGVDLAHYVRIPGLSPNTAVGTLFDRSGYRRVSGTTSHPIEFGVVLAAVLPLALHSARFAPGPRQRRLWWSAVGIIALALPMSVARSGMIGAAIVVVVMFFTWPPALRARLAVAGITAVAMMSVLVPGLLGTIKSLFLNVGSDPSTQGRTADYGPAWGYIRESPLFGRGLGTFLPELYRTLDNQLLGLTIETGFVGLASFAVLVLTSVAVALRVRAASTSPSTRDLAMSLVAGVAVITVNAATFDAFGFSMCVGTLFVLIGLVAALWVQQTKAVSTSGESRSIRLPWRREPVPVPAWPARSVVFAVALLLCLASARGEVTRAAADYRATATVFLAPPQGPAGRSAQNTGRTGPATSILHDVMMADPVRGRLLSADARFELAVGDGSVEEGTDIIGYGPTLRIRTVASTASRADAELERVITEMSVQLTAMQDKVGVPRSEAITLNTVQKNDAHKVAGRRSRALAGFALLVGLLSAIGWRTFGRYRLWAQAREAPPRHGAGDAREHEPMALGRRA